MRQAHYPRLHALLDAIADRTLINDDDHNVRFDGDGGPLLLDQLPLPPGTPPEAEVR